MNNANIVNACILSRIVNVFEKQAGLGTDLWNSAAGRVNGGLRSATSGIEANISGALMPLPGWNSGPHPGLFENSENRAEQNKWHQDQIDAEWNKAYNGSKNTDNAYIRQQLARQAPMGHRINSLKAWMGGVPHASAADATIDPAYRQNPMPHRGDPVTEGMSTDERMHAMGHTNRRMPSPNKNYTTTQLRAMPTDELMHALGKTRPPAPPPFVGPPAPPPFVGPPAPPPFVGPPAPPPFVGPPNTLPMPTDALLHALGRTSSSYKPPQIDWRALNNNSNPMLSFK